MTSPKKYILTLFLLMLPVFYFFHISNLGNYTDCCHVNPWGHNFRSPPIPLFTWINEEIINTYVATPILHFGSQLHEGGESPYPLWSWGGYCTNFLNKIGSLGKHQGPLSPSPLKKKTDQQVTPILFFLFALASRNDVCRQVLVWSIWPMCCHP